jgi:hypothetical protein
MKIPETDISSIAKVIESRPAEAALPSNLDDEILYQIARDLRLIEHYATVDENFNPPFAGPLCLIFHMLQSQSQKLKGKQTFELSEDGLTHWVQRYMHFIEREIVSRAINMPCKFDADDLMLEIQQVILTTK